MKTIFITGGTRGIGRALAERFYRAGWQVGMCARNADALAEAAAAMPGLRTWVCDISRKEEVKALGDAVREAFPVLDVLVNNGGIFQPGQVHTEDESVFETLMATNVSSAYYLTRELVPGMKARRSGTVVNLCSIASIMAYDNGGSYTISKFALLGFSKVLREEMKPHGVRVVSVMPGAVWTSSWEHSGVDPERIMPVEDIAELIWTAVGLNARTVVEEILIRPQLGDL